jgi:hypothetical protein
LNETADLKRPFLVGLLATAIAFLIMGGLIAVFATRDDRPEGVAERWLTAVGDLTRKGVRSDTEKRVTKHGDLSLANLFITAGHDYDGKTAFTALEVGRGRRVNAQITIVPMKITDRADDKKTEQAVLVMQRSKDSWRVVAVQPASAELRVPSDGGPSVSEAPVTLYGVALLLGVGVAVTASALVRAAGREQDALRSTA